jgi:hypothetical protein
MLNNLKSQCKLVPGSGSSSNFDRLGAEDDYEGERFVEPIR